MTPRRITPTALLLTAALHLALLFALLSPHARPGKPAADGAAIQWLLPAPKPAARPVAPPRQENASTAPRVQRPSTAEPAASQARQAESAEAAIPQSSEPLAPAARTEPAQDDPFAAGAPATATTAQLIMKSGYGAGAADRDLRGGKAAKLAEGGNALQAKIDEAFSAAVARKRWDPATIQEISTPSERVRVYKMTTSSGTVCISIPDPSMEKTYRYRITNCPREDMRGTVSPAVAPKAPRPQS